MAQAHCAEYADAEKSLAAAVAVLNSRIANLKKMETSDNITKELADLTLLCTEIKERTVDHEEMQKGTYKEVLREFGEKIKLFPLFLPFFLYFFPRKTTSSRSSKVCYYNFIPSLLLTALLLRSRGARDRH